MTGVLTRKHVRMLPKMAGKVGIAKSLAALTGQCFDEIDIPVLHLDGLAVHTHHILAAVGVDIDGNKHLMGLAQGLTANGVVSNAGASPVSPRHSLEPYRSCPSSD